MSEIKNADDFISNFEKLSENDQKEAAKKLMFNFCEIAMADRSIIQEMMPRCMEMMNGKDFPMKEMLSRMMSNP